MTGTPTPPSTSAPGYEPFPPAVGTDDRTMYIHETNGDEYIFDGKKESWRVMSAVKNRVFTGPYSPDTPILGGSATTSGYVPTAGDMWWDTNLLELRVWNQPEPENPSDPPIPGRWISSTNPHMSPLSPKKNLVIGNLTFLDGASEELTNGVIYENSTYDYEISRTESNAPDDSVTYQWYCLPDKINGVDVEISNPTAKTTRITTPPLARDGAGNPILQSLRIFCRVDAVKDVDLFIEPSKSIDSGILALREVPISVDPVKSNVTIKVIADSDPDLGIGTDPTEQYVVYEIDSGGKLTFKGYNNTVDLNPPGSVTYAIYEASISSTSQTTVLEFTYATEGDLISYPLSFFENADRTIPWGTTMDTGADLGTDIGTLTQTIVVDENYLGNVYFSKKPVGTEPTMAGHIEWGYAPPAEGSIGNVTLTGTTSPSKNTPETYVVGFDGDLDPSKAEITITTTDPDATIDQDAKSINFINLGFQRITSTIRSIYADDSPKFTTLDVVVQDGPSTIGDVTINGADETVVGIPEVFTTNITGDSQDYTIDYTTTDTGASITAGSIIFSATGTFDVTSTVTSSNVIDSGQSDTKSVDVKTGISATLTTAKAEVETNVPTLFSFTPDTTINNATYTWKTTRSSGGSQWDAKPSDIVITPGTSGRDTGEELVDGDVSGDSFIRLDRSTGITNGLFIYYPEQLTPVQVGLIVSTVDIDGNPDDSELVNLTLNTIPVDGSSGHSVTTSVQVTTPTEITLDLPFIDEDIRGVRIQTTTAGGLLAIHGFSVNRSIISSYINDEIVPTDDTATITMYKFDEDRTVQCMVEGDEGRSVARLAIPVIDPPEPTLGKIKFTTGPTDVEAGTPTTYEFVQEDATVTAEWAYLVEITTEGTITDESALYSVDETELQNGSIDITFAEPDADNNWTSMTAKVVAVATDTRQDIDDADRLDSKTSNVSGINVTAP